MTSESTCEAVARLPRPPLWAIGTYEVNRSIVDFPISWEDLDRDTEWAKALLESYGIGPGDHVLVISGGWEAPWYWPFPRAIMALGATYAATEVWGFDAGRSAMFLRRLPIRMVIGLGIDVVTGIAAQADLAEVFGDVETVLARPAAVPVLAHAGVPCRTLFPLGPALAVEGPDRPGAIVNAAEWGVSSNGGELLITTVGPRLHKVRAERTGLHGRVMTAGGAPEIRIFLDDVAGQATGTMVGR